MCRSHVRRLAMIGAANGLDHGTQRARQLGLITRDLRDPDEERDLMAVGIGNGRGALVIGRR